MRTAAQLLGANVWLLDAAYFLVLLCAARPRAAPPHLQLLLRLPPDAGVPAVRDKPPAGFHPLDPRNPRGHGVPSGSWISSCPRLPFSLRGLVAWSVFRAAPEVEFLGPSAWVSLRRLGRSPSGEVAI